MTPSHESGTDSLSDAETYLSMVKQVTQLAISWFLWDTASVETVPSSTFLMNVP